jgi:hypothetical protein
VHPLEGGALRRKGRRERRPGLPRKSILSFYPRIAIETAVKAGHYAAVIAQVQKILKETLAAPDHRAYSDVAIAPPEADEFDNLNLYRLTQGGEAAVARKRRDDLLRAVAG